MSTLNTFIADSNRQILSSSYIKVEELVSHVELLECSMNSSPTILTTSSVRRHAHGSTISDTIPPVARRVTPFHTDDDDVNRCLD